jgi:hypothetical protein
MTNERLAIDEYARFVGVRSRTIRSWITAGFIRAADIEGDGRLWRSGASIELIARLATPTAARLAFLEVTELQAETERAAAALQNWAGQGPPRTWKEIAVGWHLAEAVRRSAAQAEHLHSIFAMFHLGPEAAERRALMRRPALPDEARAPAAPFDVRNPDVIPFKPAAARQSGRFQIFGDGQ